MAAHPCHGHWLGEMATLVEFVETIAPPTQRNWLADGVHRGTMGLSKRTKLAWLRQQLSDDRMLLRCTATTAPRELPWHQAARQGATVAHYTEQADVAFLFSGCASSDVFHPPQHWALRLALERPAFEVSGDAPVRSDEWFTHSPEELVGIRAALAHFVRLTLEKGLYIHMLELGFAKGGIHWSCLRRNVSLSLEEARGKTYAAISPLMGWEGSIGLLGSGDPAVLRAFERHLDAAAAAGRDRVWGRYLF